MRNIQTNSLEREEFLVTWWSPLCTVTILPFSFVIVYCLGLYGGDSLFCLIVLDQDLVTLAERRGLCFFCFCLHTISLSPFLLSRSQPYGRVSVLVLGS